MYLAKKTTRAFMRESNISSNRIYSVYMCFGNFLLYLSLFLFVLNYYWIFSKLETYSYSLISYIRFPYISIFLTRSLYLPSISSALFLAVILRNRFSEFSKIRRLLASLLAFDSAIIVSNNYIQYTMTSFSCNMHLCKLCINQEEH